MNQKVNRWPLKKTAILASILLTTVGCGDDYYTLDDSKAPAANAAPTVTSTATLSIEALKEYSYQLQASDSNASDTLTYEAITVPAWLAFDASTGMLSGTPSMDDVGEHLVELSVSDGTEVVNHSFTIVVGLPTSGSNWSLVWSDEFDGSALNAEKWNVETGDGSQYGIPGWGNNELEWYETDNISVNEGNLIITAQKEDSNGYGYTSGRLRTDNKLDITYGRIEARIKVPEGQGLWSAFWMLPTDSQYGGWASGGELDIMEAVSPGTGNDDVVHGTAHYGMAWPLNSSAGDKADMTPIDDFHTYAIEWEEDEIRWFIDDYHYATITSENWWSYYYASQEEGYKTSEKAPFNQDFHVLLNLAVGGNWPGSPNAETVFPAEMLVDYVRVYECDSGLASGMGCANNINSTVMAPAPATVYTNEQVLYQEGAGQLSWQLGEQMVTRDLSAGVGWDNGGAITVTEETISGEHGMVLDINTTSMGNVLINAADGETIGLFGMGNSAQWWELAAGELKFDLYIDSALTPDDSFITIKMDSGWPALGLKQLAVADLPKDTWTTVSVKVNDLIATPGDQALDTKSVVNLFVIEFSDAAHVQVDNISLMCGHKTQDGCGITPPAIELPSETVDIFTDSVNADLWTNGIGAWDNVSNMDYYESSASRHVNWSIVDTGEEGHDSVLEVNFNADGGDGVFYIQSAQPVDLTALVDGNLVFDIKVTDYADTTSGITYKVDCIFPCTTGDQLLGVVGDGEWETITIPVSDLVAKGLDITSVNAPIVLFPTWGDQQGVTFQVDNIRWQLGDDDVTPAPEPEVGEGVVIYSEDLDSNWSLWDCCGGATYAQVVEGGDYGNVAEVTFNGAPTVSGFEAATPVDVGSLTSGTLEFDLKMLGAPADSSAEWLLKVESDGAATFAEVTLDSSNEGIAPTLDTWQHFTFDLSTLNAQGLDLTSVKLIMIFPTWGKAGGAQYRIDNVVIKSE